MNQPDPKDPEASVDSSLALDIRHLRKTYENGFEALKGINLKVHHGEFVALLGPNGAGKSTTIGIISSLVNKTSGQVSICGYDLDTRQVLAKQHLGVVPQEFNFNQFERVEDIVVTQGGFYGLPKARCKQQAEKYLRQLGLWDKRRERSRNLSGGMKRRLMIARALVHEPQVLILDEPTAGVDIELRRSMWTFLTELNQQGKTIILTTHYLEEAEQLCRRVAIIDRGEIVEDTSVRDLLTRLDHHTIVLDLKAPLSDVPDLGPYPAEMPDSRTLEVTLANHESINKVFARLSELGIDVVSMRNKTNRLEELFVSLVEKNLAG